MKDIKKSNADSWFLKLPICFVAIYILSCSPAPVADFSYLPQNPVAGQSVQFTNMSKNAKSYSWNFGNMAIGDEQNPSHVYGQAGSYIVDLTAHRGLQSDTKTITLVVN